MTYQAYILFVSTLPFVIVAIVLSDQWAVVGLILKIKKLWAWVYVRDEALRRTNELFKIVKEESKKDTANGTTAKKLLKKMRWNRFYDLYFEEVQSEIQSRKKDIELEYEERQNRFENK